MLKILFEDDIFIAVDKPSGLASDQTKDPKRDSAISLLKKQKPESKLILLHRLDRETSGVLLFCKNPEFNEVAALLFRERQIQKEYFCLIKGAFPEKPQQVKNFLKLEKINARQGKMRAVRSGGQSAWTDFELIQKTKTLSLVRAFPRTGRTHQIRVHIADLGFPIEGDALYGKNSPESSRLYLHALSLQLLHPVSGEKILIESNLPSEFTTRLKSKNS